MSREVPVFSLPPNELHPGSLGRIKSVAQDWGTVKLKCPDAWKTATGKGVKVFVLDTGVDANHPDLKDNIDVKLLKDFSGSRFGAIDRQGHGTHCSGTIAEVAPDCVIGHAKVLGDNGSGGVDNIAAGINWAVANGADVISMSLGGPGADSYIPPALDRALAAGVLVIVAAGNEGPNENTVGYPGAYPQSLAVAAVDENLTVARFSSRGRNVFVAAPGVNVRSTYPGGQYATMSGTSMATPHVAGLAALWVEANRDKLPKANRPDRFRKELVAACRDHGAGGWDTAYGNGFPDAVKLVGEKAVQPPPPPPPPALDLEEELAELLRKRGWDVKEK